MTVPFEQLGPGQVGRLVYQVIGKDGPVMNPQNIRYLDPGTGVADPASHAELAAGIASVNLVATVANVALTAQVLSEVRRLHQELNLVHQRIADVDHTVKEVLRRVERIDTQVAENNLRHAMDHVFKRAVTPDGIDVASLAALANDLESFQESLAKSLFFNLSVRLSTDVRDNLGALCSFLVQLRYLVAWQHNRAVLGDPFRSIAMAPEREYLGADFLKDVAASATYTVTAGSYGDALQSVVQALDERFTWSDSDDQEHFIELLQQRFAGPFDETFAKYLSPSVIISDVVPDEILQQEDADAVISQVVEIGTAWLWRSDGGLVYRALMETKALEHGYQYFWDQMDGAENAGVTEIHGSCTLELPA